MTRTSRELVDRLADAFPGSEHVTSAALERANDREVWDYARANGCAIVSKDSDFNQLSFLYGAPPKVIWLRVGNCTTEDIEQKLRSHIAEIAAFDKEEETSVMIID